MSRSLDGACSSSLFVGTHQGQWTFPHPTHSESALLRSKESGEYWERHALKAPETPAPCLIRFEEQFVPWRTLRDAIGTFRPPRSHGHSRVAAPCRWPGALQYRGHAPNEGSVSQDGEGGFTGSQAGKAWSGWTTGPFAT